MKNIPTNTPSVIKKVIVILSMLICTAGATAEGIENEWAYRNLQALLAMSAEIKACQNTYPELEVSGKENYWELQKAIAVYAMISKAAEAENISTAMDNTLLGFTFALKTRDIQLKHSDCAELIDFIPTLLEETKNS